jgi:hypothetical protein
VGIAHDPVDGLVDGARPTKTADLSGVSRSMKTDSVIGLPYQGIVDGGIAPV